MHDGLTADEAVSVRCFTEGHELLGNHDWLKIGKDGQLGGSTATPSLPRQPPALLSDRRRPPA